MSKRLIVLLALAFVVGITAASYAEVQNVKVSGDITAYGINRDLSLTKTDNDNAYTSLLSITRVKVDADLTDNVMTTVRLINERYWGSNDADAQNSDIDLDLAMVTLKEFLYSPATLIVGKQEMHFGNDMIVGDARSDVNVQGETAIDSDPDLSMRKSFDAIRLILDYNPLTLNLVAAQVSEDTRGRANANDDVNLYGINATFEVDEATTAEGYYWLKDSKRYSSVTSPDGLTTSTDHKDISTHVLGVRGVIKPLDTLTLQLEGAYQAGRALNNLGKVVKRSAFALEAAAGLTPTDMKYAPTLTGLYAYFSGQKGNGEKAIKAWDPMFENQKFGDIANTQFPQSNAHILGVVGTMVPAEDVILKGEYYVFLWDKVYGPDDVLATVRGDSVSMKHRKFAGQEVDLTGTYNYTEDVQFNLLGGVFFPGSSFSSQNDHLASEVIGSMRVTF